MESIYTTIGKNNKWIYLFRQTGSKIMKVIFLDCSSKVFYIFRTSLINKETMDLDRSNLETS